MFLKNIDLTKYKRILIVTAHPDDMEGWVGGLAKEASLLGSSVYSIIFSTGNFGIYGGKEYKQMDPNELADLRILESEHAADILGIKAVIPLWYEDRKIIKNEESIALLERWIKRINPDLVISLEFSRFRNYEPHPDHITVGDITKLTLRRIKSQSAFFVASTLTPTHFIDYTKFRKKKLMAAKCHQSQWKFLLFTGVPIEFFFSTFFGLFVRGRYVEVFRKVKY